MKKILKRKSFKIEQMWKSYSPTPSVQPKDGDEEYPVFME